MFTTQQHPGTVAQPLLSSHLPSAASGRISWRSKAWQMLGLGGPSQINQQNQADSRRRASGGSTLPVSSARSSETGSAGRKPSESGINIGRKSIGPMGAMTPSSPSSLPLLKVSGDTSAAISSSLDAASLHCFTPHRRSPILILMLTLATCESICRGQCLLSNSLTGCPPFRPVSACTGSLAGRLCLHWLAS